MSGVIAAAGITAAAGLGSGLLASGKGSGGTQQQTTQQQLPQWVENAGMENWGRATRAGYELMKPYEGQRVADMTPEQRDLIARMYGNVGSGNAAYDQAGGMLNGLSGFSSGQLTPQMLRDTNLQPYMSPYTQGVIDPTMRLMEQSRRQAIGQIGDQATQARAFGGSRQGVAEGVTNAQSELQKGGFAANLYGQNFLNAQQQAVGDIGRDWQGQTANMAARQYDAGFQRDLAGRVAGLADARQGNFLSGVTAAMGGQQMLQKQAQDQLAAQQAYYNEQKQYPLDQLAIWQNGLAQSPYSKSTVQTSPGPSTDPWMTGLGTAGTVGGLMGSFGKMRGMFGDSPYGTTSNPATMASPDALRAWNTSQLG